MPEMSVWFTDPPPAAVLASGRSHALIWLETAPENPSAPPTPRIRFQRRYQEESIRHSSCYFQASDLPDLLALLTELVARYRVRERAPNEIADPDDGTPW